MALVDVSDPTASLVWEIQQLRERSLSAVFVASGEHFRSWTQRLGDGLAAVDARRVHELLGGDRVIVYDAHDSHGGDSFIDELQSGIQRSAAAHPPFAQAVGRLRHTLRELLVYAVGGSALILVGRDVCLVASVNLAFPGYTHCSAPWAG